MYKNQLLCYYRTKVVARRRSYSRTALFMAMLKLIFLIITFPVWFPIITVVSAVIFAFALVVSLTGFAITAAAAALSIAGILAFVLFIAAISNSVASGLMGLGGGCILLGLGLMIGTAGINLCIKLFPWLMSIVRRIFTKPFHRKQTYTGRSSNTRDIQNTAGNSPKNYTEEEQ